MRNKILIAIIINVVLISVTLGVISYITIHESINQALQNKLALTKIIAKYVDISLDNNINRLYEISHSENNTNRQQRQKMLESVYKYSVFSEGVFILDKYGNTLVTYPDKIEQYLNLTHIIHVNQVIREGQPVVSNVYTIEPAQKKVIFIFVPIKDSSDKVAGIIGGMIGPTSQLFNELLLSAKREWGGFAEIIDINENIVASSNPSLTFQPHNHDNMISKLIKEGVSGIIECHHSFNYSDSEEYTKDFENEGGHLLTVVPIRLAKWAVIIGQPKSQIFSTAKNLELNYVLVVVIFIIISTLISIYLSRKIVSPIKSLISAVNNLASGDLSTPIKNLGSDEILKLSKSFDEMRQKLAESYERIRIYNTELEKIVESRTHEIEENRQIIKQLLRKVINSQEDERKRVARDLHDTILQDISAFLIKLDICKQHPEIISVEKIDEMRNVAIKTIDNIHNIIKNLRPTMLDDLGLQAALNVLVTTHLLSKGISCQLDIKTPLIGKLSPNVEISVFRVIQEAIRNISRHSQAENAFISIDIKESFLEIIIEDDGLGFNVDKFMLLSSDNGRGLGIIGMKERVSLLGGDFNIQSSPAEGTRLFIRIPMHKEAKV